MMMFIEFFVNALHFHLNYNKLSKDGITTKLFHLMIPQNFCLSCFCNVSFADMDLNELLL